MEMTGSGPAAKCFRDAMIPELNSAFHAQYTCEA